MIKDSLKHLKENNMSYVEHFIFAFTHGCLCIKAGFFLIIHSFVPGLFQSAGSRLVRKLSESFTIHTTIKIVEKEMRKDR